MTFISFITDAYFIAGLISEVESPSAEQGAKAVTCMNDMMADMAESGIDLGWVPVGSTSATISLPLGHVQGLKALLAVRLCSRYGVQAPAQAVADADKGYRRLLGQAVSQQIERAQSDTLPAGNAQRFGYNILTG